MLERMDKKALAVEVFGDAAILNHNQVHGFYMSHARLIRELVAEDLGGEVDYSGKEFVRTYKGLFRVSAGNNSDNATELREHERLGVRNVVVFGSRDDALTLAELYDMHGYELDEQVFFDELRELVLA